MKGGSNSASGIYEGIKNSIRVLKNEGDSAATFRNLAKESRKFLQNEVGSAQLSKIPDEEIILLDYMTPGKSKVKDFFAARSATTDGSLDVNLQKQILEMSNPDFSAIN